MSVNTRFHVGLHVTDLARSVRFYRTLLGSEPVKHVPDYARFESDRPAIVIGLYPSPQPAGGALNHVGLRFPDSAALVDVQRRLEEVGIATQRQDGVECCYSRQTKFWVTDPDKVLWEIYTKHEDIEHSGFEDAPTCPPSGSQKVWQHRITDPVPGRIPHEDASLDEVMLEGTFNAAVGGEKLEQIVAEAKRVLKPGGRITVHGLVGSAPFPGTPNLPGIASLVRRVPVETEPLDLLNRAGFVGLFFENLGDIHCFQVNGVELRELRLHGWKPRTNREPSAVMYKGPLDAVTSECGTTFRRGEIVTLSGDSVARLRSGPSGDQFAFLK